MKKVIGSVLLASLVCGFANAQEEKKDTTGFIFTDVKVAPTTSVKNQNKSGTCWCFSGVSQVEEDILRNGGKPLDLSEMYIVRQCYLDKADRFIRMGGQSNFSPGGSILDVPLMIEQYGIVPEEVYHGVEYGEDGHVHAELQAVLEAYLNAVNKHPNRRLSTAWRKGFEGILDAYLGEVPETFVVDGKTYTPQSYAKSLAYNPSEFVPFTSFTHHPYYTPFVLEVADNWFAAPYQNVPLDELKAIVDNAIDGGYTVLWAADVSEPGFKWRDGVAVMPKAKDEKDLSGTELARWVKLTDAEKKRDQYNFNGPVDEITVTPESRQEGFDRFETTDDHGMVIVGRATDQNGKNYYKVKNSWDDKNHKYNGFFYVSEPYFLAKTMSILVNKNAVPASVAKKLK